MSTAGPTQALHRNISTSAVTTQETNNPDLKPKTKKRVRERSQASQSAFESTTGDIRVVMGVAQKKHAIQSASSAGKSREAVFSDPQLTILFKDACRWFGIDLQGNSSLSASQKKNISFWMSYNKVTADDIVRAMPAREKMAVHNVLRQLEPAKEVKQSPGRSALASGTLGPPSQRHSPPVQGALLQPSSPQPTATSLTPASRINRLQKTEARRTTQLSGKAAVQKRVQVSTPHLALDFLKSCKKVGIEQLDAKSLTVAQKDKLTLWF
jgi:hypothetical protein